MSPLAGSLRVWIIALVAVSGFGLPAQERVYGPDAVRTVLQSGHASLVGVVAYGSSGRLVLTGGADHTARIWEAATGREIRALAGHRGDILSLAFSPDERYVLTGSKDGTVRVWEAATGREVRRMTGVRAAFSPDGQLIATAGRDHFVRIWERETGREVGSFKAHTDEIWQVGFSPDGSLVITGSRDGRVSLWNAGIGQAVASYRGSSADFSPDGRFMALSVGDGRSLLVERASGRVLAELTGYWPAFSPDGSLVVTGHMTESGEHLARIYDGRTGREVAALPGYPHAGDTLARFSAAFGPESRLLLMSHGYGSARLWSVGSRELVRSFEGHVSYVSAAGFSGSGRLMLVSAGDRDDTVRIWDSRTGRQIRTVSTGTGEFYASFSPDETSLLIRFEHGPARLVDVATGREIRRFADHGENFTPRDSFSPDGRMIVTGGEGGSLHLWRLETGSIVRTLGDEDDPQVINTGFSPDGRFLVSVVEDGGDDGETVARLWDLASGREVRRFRSRLTELEEWVGPVRFTPGGEAFLVASDSGVTLWETDSGRRLATLGASVRDPALRPAYHGTFSPDGRLIATASHGGDLVLWRSDTREVLRVFEGRYGLFDFSPDGRFLIAVSDTSSGAAVLDVQSGTRLGAIHLFAGGEWIFKTANGFFDLSERAGGYAHFVRGLEVLELGQFFDDFYRPRLLGEILAGGAAALPDIRLAARIAQYPPPEVVILSPKPGERMSRSEITVRLRVTDSGGGIDEVALFHNGKRVDGGEARGLREVDRKVRQGRTEMRTFRVRLVAGPNVLEASAHSSGRVESRRRKLTVSFPGTERRAMAHILAVGVNTYRNSRLNLNYARADAAEFAAVLEERGRRLFRETRVEVLLDADATRERILESLDRISREAGPGDVFSFYFAGHGSVAGGEFFFVTHENVRLYEEQALRRDALSMTVLQDRLEKIQALKQLVVVDACQSGAVAESLSYRGAAEEKALAQLHHSTGVHVLASAGSEQFAAEFAELGHGVFTYALISGMSGEADGVPRDGKVTIFEIKGYLDDRVPALTAHHRGEAQYPNTFSMGQDFPLTLAD